MPSSIKLVFLVCLSMVEWNAFGDEVGRNLSQATLASQRVLVSLPEETFVALKINSTDLGGEAFSWSGKLTGAKTGFLSFAKVSNYLNGSITLTNGGGYSFRGPMGSLEFQAGFAHAKTCGGCKFEQGLPPDPRSAAQPLQSWRNGDANLVDILVVYPSAVRAEAGSTNAVEATIASAIADANLCYRNSLVPMQLRVVHTEEVSYTPTGQLSIDLDRLKNSSDGSMDNVHSLRDQYGADLVSLLTTTSDSGGLASTMQHPSLSFESSGFNVNVWSQLGAPSYTLAHEIGHNMGCLHNREDSTWSADYEFAAFCFGKRWLQNGEGYRTVMSYDSSSSAYNNRLPFFSNPNVSYLSTSTGNAGTEDNSQVLSLSVPYVSNFRKSVVQAILPTVFELQVNEGDSASFKVRLTVEPVSLVQVTATMAGDGDLFISGPSTLTFDSGNWNIGQTVQVSGQADSDSANGSSTLTLSASGIPSSTVQFTENDSGTSLEPDFLVAGIVSNDLGMGLSGVMLTLSNAGGALQSDANGSFRSIIASGWSGTITPTKDGYAFTPSSISVGSLGANSIGHEFSAARSSILYVDKDAVGSGDGTNWNNAFVDLSEALLSQSSFNEIWVAEGTYLPGTVRPSTFLIPPQVTVYGGFAGNEGSRADRDISAHPTILSGDLGTQGADSDNSFHVVIPSHGSTLDGFTIRDGYASKNFSDDRGKGAGLWADSSSFTVRNCTISDNRSYQGGSGAYLKDANATFIDCVFSTNVADSTGRGGAVYVEDSNATFQSCSFVSNFSGFEGGAMKWKNSVGSMTDCNLTENQNTASNGAGALHLDGSPISFVRCDFTRNSTSANSYGGAVKIVSSSPVFTDCVFTRNSNPGNSGGAIHVDDSSTPTFTGNEFRFNSSAQFGGAIFTEGNLNMAGGLFLGNYARYGGGVASQGSVSCSFSKVRIFGNEANSSGSSSGGFAYFNTGTTGSTFVNCAISGNKSLGRNGVYKPTGPTRFVNCSIVGNESGDLGGIVILFSGNSIALDNCIIWGNTAASGGNDVYVNSQTASANYSLFDSAQSSGSISGSNNLNSDPLFTDANGADNMYGTEDDDLSLLASSSAVDSASASVADYSTTDILGLARSGNPDRGAYEFIPASPPVFTSSSSFSAQENQTGVGTVTATDSNGDVLAYSISGGADQSKFSLDSSTGVLSFLSAPDFENPADSGTNNVYELTVQVSDGSSQPTQNILVTVLDINESVPNTSPDNLDSNGTLVMRENEVIGSVVGVFTAVDPDANATLQYSLYGTSSGNAYFTLDQNGTLSTAAVLDYETNASHEIRVRVHDEHQAYAEGNFTVTVLDVNESVPNTSPDNLDSNGTLVMRENEVIGSVVGVFTAVDPDANATLQYSLYGTNPGNTYFTLDQNGTLSTAAVLDYETNASHEIRVRVHDEHQAYAEGNFTVTVLDLNEGAPNDYRGMDISVQDLSGQDLRAALFDHTTVFSSLVLGFRVGTNLLGTDANLTGLSLQQTDFRGVNLAGVDLTNAHLTVTLSSNGTNNQVSKLTALFDSTTVFSGLHPITLQRVSANLSNWVGSGATLVGPYPGTDFRGVNVAGADLSGADLSQSLFDQTTVFSMVNPANGQNVGANLNGSNAQLTNISFGLADFRGTELAGVNFTRSDLSAARFDASTVFSAIDSSTNQRVGANFLATDANFSGLDLQQKDFRGVNLGGIDLSNSNLSSALFDHTTVFSGIDPLTNQRVGVNLSNVMGSAAVLTGPFPGANFGAVNLAGVNLSDSDLSQSTFSHATVFSVHDAATGQSVGANLTGSNAQLLNIAFGETDLRGTQLAGVNFAGSDLSSAFFDQSIVFSALDPSTNQQVGVSLLATDANLTGLNLRQTDFRGVNLAGVNLSNANLTGALFDHTTVFSGIDPGTLQRVGANLSNLTGNGASLSGPFPGIEFRETNLMGVHLEGADLSSTQMDLSTILTQSTYDQTTQWPSGIDPVARGAIYTGPNRVPVITTPSAASIPENQPLAFDINASDPDGDTLGYVITGGSDEFKFEINASTGLLVFETNASAGMDFEIPVDANNDNVYEVTIGVSDGSELVHQNISVIITDENDAPENFEVLASLNVKENQSIGLFVGEFNASDQDAGSNLVYALTSGAGDSGNGLFALESNGTLRTAEVLDYESNASRLIRVRVTDDRGASIEAVFAFTVEDENDPPANLVAPSALNIMENQPVSSVVGEFTASDEDANATLTYELASGAGDADNGLFALEANGTLKTSIVFDFENNASSYAIRVRVRDEHNASVEGVFSVNLTDLNEAPVNLVAVSGLNVAENQPIGSLVGGFAASDEDANATLTYELVSGAGDADNGLFALEVNGTLKASIVFDFESNASTYSVRVRAKDEHNASVESMFAVYLADLNEAPFNLVSVSVLSVLENQPSGSLVGEFNATDQDANSSLTYELASGAGGEANGLFFLDVNGTLKTAALFDFENNASSYAIRVRVRDEHNISIEGIFTVNLLDLNEVPFDLVSVSVLSVAENQTVGSMVGEFNATDQDANSSLTYELVSGEGDSGNGLFSLESNGTLRTAEVLNYESNVSRVIRVRVKDEYNASVEGVFSVNLTDLNEAPVNLVAVSSLNVAENQPSGSLVGEFNATDQDANATLTYELVSGAGDADNGLFALDANGTLKTATIFDFESNASTYSVRVRAKDEHNVSAEDTFTVNLLDLNEVPFNLVSTGSLSVAENQPTGSFVGEFNASDYDANATLLYYLHESNVPAGNQYFTLDLNGTLRTAVSLDYEREPSHLIRIRVYDEFRGYAESNFTVTVLDLNESGSAPAFDFNATVLQVEENADIGTYVGRFSSFGGDANASVNYILNSDAGGAHLKFSVDANGSLRTLVALDYEESDQWTLYVTAANDVNETMTDFFTVSVLDVNETVPNNPPDNLDFNATLAIRENEPVGTIVGSFDAVDPDANATLQYYLHDGNGTAGNAYFTLDLNGTLSTAAVMDYEANGSHLIRVRVYDEHQAYAEGNFTVMVLDVNETVPNASPENLNPNGTLVIGENEAVGTVVGFFSAVDPDGNTSLRYYLYDANDTPGNAYFTLDLNGTLRTASVLDYEANASHLLRVRAYDDLLAYAEGNFTVAVLDVNEVVPNNPPTGLAHIGPLSVFENEAVGTVVDTFTAIDPDGNGNLRYYLYDGNESYAMSPNGALWTTRELDYETNSSHLIRVRVYDDDQAYAEGNFTVAVLDINESEPNPLFDFNASALRVWENAPVGTYAGQFSSFGGEPNATVTFALNPDAAGAYLKFEINASGSLRTLVALDYEETSQWTLNVTALNDFDESASRSFVLDVTNLYEAPVNYSPSDITAPDGLSIKQNDPVGTVVGTFEVFDINDSGFHAFELVGGEGSADNALFFLDLNGTLRNASVLSYDQNRSLSVRIRVTDSWYLSYEESFSVSYVAVAPPGESVGLISDGTDLGGGWKRAGWFGYYFGAFYPWVYHENLGWLYVAQESAVDTWLHHKRLGWVWTNRHVFPHMYVFKRSHWIFLDRTTLPAKLFDYSYMEWFELDRKYQIAVSMAPSVGGTLSGTGVYYRWDPVRIEAIPKSGYLFNGWNGDLKGNHPVVEFEAVGDFNLTGSFIPDFSSGQWIDNLNEFLESLDHLTPAERQSAMAEILIDGKSSNAGIDLRGGDQ